MKFQYNDGGRKAAGYKGHTKDCVCRAIAIATGKPYQEVYDALNGLATKERTGKRKRKVSRSDNGVFRVTYQKYLESIGWTWVPTMKIGAGCTVHLNEKELPSGRLVVAVSRHLTAVIDGVIHDTHNPSERGGTIYPAGCLFNIPKGAKQLSNGDWFYNPERCVYGYFLKK